MTSPHDEDRHILSKCISGDREATETFVMKFSGLVYYSIQGALLTRHVSFTSQDLEDLHNTVFLKLFERRCRKLRQFEGRNGCSLKRWIGLITVRIVLNHIRERGVDTISWQKKRISIEDLPELMDRNMDSSTVIEESEKGQILQNGIRNLPPRDRLFMKLHFENELPMEEVAAIMKVSVQNAYTIKHRAINKLKSYALSLRE